MDNKDSNPALAVNRAPAWLTIPVHHSRHISSLWTFFKSACSPRQLKFLTFGRKFGDSGSLVSALMLSHLDETLPRMTQFASVLLSWPP